MLCNVWCGVMWWFRSFQEMFEKEKKAGAAAPAAAPAAAGAAGAARGGAFAASRAMFSAATDKGQTLQSSSKTQDNKGSACRSASVNVSAHPPTLCCSLWL
jgi:hypothetical protein